MKTKAFTYRSNIITLREDLHVNFLELANTHGKSFYDWFGTKKAKTIIESAIKQFSDKEEASDIIQFINGSEVWGHYATAFAFSVWISPSLSNWYYFTVGNSIRMIEEGGEPAGGWDK